MKVNSGGEISYRASAGKIDVRDNVNVENFFKGG